MKIHYIAEPTPARFHQCDSFYRGLRGPVRSGKSTAMCIEIINRARRQVPSQSGIRRTRWASIRNTYRELEDTTLKTWLMWFPEDIFGSVNRRTMTHLLQFNDIHCEVLFRALDRPEDISKLLSMEVTGGWINEAREVPKAVVDTLGDRVEQYPSKMDEGCTWGGVFMDTNAPDEDHWWYGLEAEPPRTILTSGKEARWDFFVQPGALVERHGKFLPNPKAENIRNLNGGHDYYLKRLAGKKESYIRVYYCNEFGYVEEGKRVHAEYNDSTHCAPSPLVPDPNLKVTVGLDFGLTPAATFFQQTATGQWRMFHEIASENIGVRRFGETELLPYVLGHLMDFDVEMWGDPSETRSQTDESTPIKILSALGFNIRPAPSQDPTIRREALSAPLSRLIDGEPGMIVDPSCKVFRKGMSSKFIYQRLQVSGDERFRDKPAKNWWSHTCEAAEYAMVGAGEGERITQRPRMTPPFNPRIHTMSGAHGWMSG